jgi:hypothetical protein
MSSTPTKRPPRTNVHERFAIKRINYQAANGVDGAGPGMAEKHVSHFRRADIGIRPHLAGARLLRAAQKPSWRKADRHISYCDQVKRIAIDAAPMSSSTKESFNHS